MGGCDLLSGAELGAWVNALDKHSVFLLEEGLSLFNRSCCRFAREAAAKLPDLRLGVWFRCIQGTVILNFCLGNIMRPRNRKIRS